MKDGSKSKFRGKDQSIVTVTFDTNLHISRKMKVKDSEPL